MNFKGIWNKAVEKAKEPRTNKQLIIEGAIGAAVMVAFGGAIIPTVAGAVAEGVIVKKVTDRVAAKKAAEKKKGKPDSGKDGPKPK